VVQAIYRRSEGDPFFVGQLMRQLRADRRDLADGRAAAEELDVPPGVWHVIGSRPARLSADANRVPEAGAVLGEGFAADVLGDTSGIGGPASLDALDEALRAGRVTAPALGARRAGASVPCGCRPPASLAICRSPSHPDYPVLFS
jgi:hypothetical protein